MGTDFFKGRLFQLYILLNIRHYELDVEGNPSVSVMPTPPTFAGPRP